MKPLIRFKQTRTLLTMLALLSSGILPVARAVFPPPDGGYPGGNTAEGENALLSLTSGTLNTAVGVASLVSDTTASLNTGVGAATLVLNTANENTATGAGALLLNTSGLANTANGALALLNNDTGSSNTAVGDQALFSTTTGSFNTATGSLALTSNGVGSDNTAIGAGALEANTASDNTAVGAGALNFNSAGTRNTAVGSGALMNNDADDNTATGFLALNDNTSGNFNTAVGVGALESNTIGFRNTALGGDALSNATSATNSVALGYHAGFNATSGDRNVYIGAGVAGVAGENNACYIASIFNTTSVNGIQVLVNSNDKLGTTTSSKRFKENIQVMDEASEALFALKPVTFRYRKEIDPQGIPQFGLLAEDVEAVNCDLVVRDKEGKPYSVRYDQVNAMLLNEFLKEHRTVQKQQREIDSLKAELDEQRRLIQRVNEKVELDRARSRLADNRQ